MRKDEVGQDMRWAHPNVERTRLTKRVVNVIYAAKQMQTT